jgi:hypothetical protein
LIYHIRTSIDERRVLAYSRDEADRRVTKAITKFMRGHLAEIRNLSTAQDHLLIVRNNGVMGNGLRLVERCEAPPCPWFGQPREATEIPERTLMTAWWEEQR